MIVTIDAKRNELIDSIDPKAEFDHTKLTESLTNWLQFEEELNAVNAAHQALVRSSERKETLERSARLRLESELRRVQQVNAALRHQNDMLSASQLALRNATSQASINCVASSSGAGAGGGSAGESVATLQSQIARRDTLIAQLVSQSNISIIYFNNSNIRLIILI